MMDVMDIMDIMYIVGYYIGESMDITITHLGHIQAPRRCVVIAPC